MTTEHIRNPKELAYKRKTHEGIVFGDIQRWEEVAKEIDETIEILKDTLKNAPITKRWYKVSEKHPKLEKIYTNIVINMKPMEDYFGWGVSTIGERGVKVYWYTKDMLIPKISQYPSLNVMPPAVLAHEILHTIGSRVELLDPLSEIVALRFYFRHPDYVANDKTYLSIGLSDFIFPMLSNRRPKLNAELLRLLYKDNPNLFEEILKKRYSLREQERIKKLLEINSEEHVEV